MTDDPDRLTEAIIGAAIEVHRELGPDLLEAAYEGCLAYELRDRGLRVEQQKPQPVFYKSNRIDLGFRIDLVVQDEVIVELKSVERLTPIHEAQLLSYLRLSRYPTGLLINCNTSLLKTGIRRLVN